MSDPECDQALEKLNKLIEWVDQSFSEADTRVKIIDPLFLECLGWDTGDIRRETHVHSGFLDYIFSVDGVRKFVLEAKKVGHSFVIPSSFRGRYYTISGTISTDKKVRAAIEQAQKYCVNSGVNYGIVSNGKQFILFEAFRYGKDWRDCKCVVFHSLEDIRDNFAHFWNTLHKKMVINGSLRKSISQEELPLNFIRPLDKIHAQDSKITRNDLSPLLQPFIDHVFSKITGDRQLDVLKICYVARKQFRDAGFQINRYLDRPPGFAKKYKVEMIVESERSAGKFQELYEKHEEFLRTKALEKSLFLLMGGIGSGKTTFIHHFFNFVAKKPKKTVWFYVDFLEAPPDPDKIEEHIYNSVVDLYERKYHRILEKEMKSVGLASIKPNAKDITILFSMLTLHGFNTSLVLDNVDQHSYVSPKYQERAVLIANYLKERLKTMTILTLREESFFRSTQSGVLDAFPVDVFHISSPSFEDMIRYRIDYILDLLNKDEEELAALMGEASGLGSSKVILRMFFEIVKDSLRSNRTKGREILRFMDDISDGDMRLALYFFRTFLLSGNTDIGEMLQIQEFIRKQGTKKGYQIPFHHVIKSIILEHSRLYAASRSKIMNLFDVNPEHTNSHFMHLRILNYLNNKRNYQPKSGRGYVEIDGIIREAERMMIKKEAVADSLSRMALFGLVQFENQSKEGYKSATYVRMTNTGTYYFEELIHEFIYLDLVWMDTPLASSETVGELLKHVVEIRREKSETDINERFERTEVFLSYLEGEETREIKNNPGFKDSDLTRRAFLPDIIKSYRDEKDYITSKRGRSRIN